MKRQLMRKLKIISKITISLVVCFIFTYFILFIWAGSFSEGLNKKTIHLDKNIELTLPYDSDTFKSLNDILNNKLDNTFLESIYSKNDNSALVFIFRKEYSFLAEFFATDYTPMKEIQVYYNIDLNLIKEITILSGNSLLMDNKYINLDEWKNKKS